MPSLSHHLPPAALAVVGKRIGEKACLPLRIRWENAGRCDGRCSVLRWLMERAARACTACSLLGCGKLLSPLGVLAAQSRRACNLALACLQPGLDVLAAQSQRTCSLALVCRTVACIARGKLALEGLRARGIILPETFLRSSFFPAKVKKTCPIVLCYARLALPLQK